jgi:hypothetical protein
VRNEIIENIKEEEKEKDDQYKYYLNPEKELLDFLDTIVTLKPKKR